jgi:hypothetical protein
VVRLDCPLIERDSVGPPRARPLRPADERSVSGVRA